MIGHMADRYMLIGSVCAIICTKLEALVVLKKKLLVDLAIQVESYYKRKLSLWKLVIDGHVRTEDNFLDWNHHMLHINNEGEG
jgi:hypothetical protein